jgi:hypothetical protein
VDRRAARLLLGAVAQLENPKVWRTAFTKPEDILQHEMRRVWLHQSKSRFRQKPPVAKPLALIRKGQNLPAGV